jgi:hypothetical protein
MRIAVTNFKGEIPRLSARLLPPGYAVEARNVKLDNGDIAPLRSPTHVADIPTGTVSIARHLNAWRTWPVPVNAVAGPVAQDRLYVTGDLQPRVITASGEVRNLALPAPATAPVVAVIGTPDPALQAGVVFAYTYVTDQDEESAPSPLSAEILWNPPLGVLLNTFAPPPAGRGVNRRRIYRSETSALGITDLYFVAEQAISENSFTYSAATHPIQEILPSNDFDTPPSDMRGLISMPNGMMAAFSGKEVLFCEPFIPHAWPVKYRFTVDFDVVALAAFGSTLVILTTGQPYISQGTAPENMVTEKIEVNYPCVSARSVVDLGYSAVYASTEGLVMVRPGGAEVISRKLWTKEQWEALSPTTFIAGQHDGAYVVSHLSAPSFDEAMARWIDLGDWHIGVPTNGAATPPQARSFMVIDMTGESPFLVHADVSAVGMHYEVQTGDLFVIPGVFAGSQIQRWDSGAPMTYRWRSGLLRAPGPVSFGAAMTETDYRDGQAITTSIIANGNPIRQTADTDVPFRLPSGLFERWQVQCEGNAPVTGYLMAGDISELLEG